MNRLTYLFSLFILVFVASCNEKSSDAKTNLIYGMPIDMTWRIAVLMGSTHDQFVSEHFPKAKILRLDTEPDIFVALDAGKADIAMLDYSFFLVSQGKAGDYKELALNFSEDFGIGFNLDNFELRDQFNEFLAEIRKNGTYDAIIDNWFTNYDLAKMPSWDKQPTGTPLRVGCTGSTDGFSFIRDGAIAGFDAEILTHFAHWLGRPIQFSFINFGGLISALNSGAVDIISSGITITEEREKQIAFSNTYYVSQAVSIVKKERFGGTEPVVSDGRIRSMDDISHSTVGLMTGTLHDQYVSTNYPTAKVMRYDTYPDMLMSLESGKTSIAFVEGVMFETSLKKKGIFEVLGVLFEDPYGVGFSKQNADLCNQFNDFLNGLKGNGIYDEIIDRWINNFETAEMPVWTDPEPKGKPLKLGCTGSTDAFDYIKNGKNAGVDIELIERFGRHIGRPIEYLNLNFGGLIAALSSGRVDMISSAMTITEERSRMVTFSQPYFISQSVAIVLKSNYDNSDNKGSEEGYRSMDDLKEKRIGVLMSSIQDEYISKSYPQAKINRIDMSSDLIYALKTKQCDAIVLAHPEADQAIKTNPQLAVLEPNIFPVYFGIGFNDGGMRDRFNTFLTEIQGNGIYDGMVRRWIDSTDIAVMPVFNIPAGTKPIVIGTTAQSVPFSFVKDGIYAGFDMELVVRFAASQGRPTEVSVITFGGLIPAIKSGKIDIMANSAMLTEERKKEVNFSDPYFMVQSTVLVLKEDLAISSDLPTEKKHWLASVKESFYNNLINEKRYQLILAGLKETIIITLFAALLGTLFGGIICFLRMSKNIICTSFAKAYISVMRGTPLLVLLMIFFYIVFASSGLSATAVAIFTFALNMGAYSSEMFRTSIEGVDHGQQEAGIALGFTKVQSFIYIVLPQAAKSVLPVYKGEVISLLKMTSIVGYIAVVDLTKASDIIRSRTFDAFFPLIVVAIIYFLLAWLLGVGLDYLNKKLSSAK